MINRIYYLLLILTFLFLIDIGIRTTVEYIPAYHLQKYIRNQKTQFNKTATKIINVVEATEHAVNTFQLFFENSFLSSVCATETGKNMLGYLCTFSGKRALSKDFEYCFENNFTKACFTESFNSIVKSTILK